MRQEGANILCVFVSSAILFSGEALRLYAAGTTRPWMRFSWVSSAYIGIALRLYYGRFLPNPSQFTIPKCIFPTSQAM